MTANRILTAVPNRVSSTVTFATATTGATGIHNLFTVTGAVHLLWVSARCTTSLTSSGGGTIEMGTANNTADIIGQTTATEIDANDLWKDAGPEVEIQKPCVFDISVGATVTLRILTGAIDTGVIEFVCYWQPISNNGNLAAPVFA